MYAVRRELIVRNVMRTNVVYVTPSNTILDAAKIMSEHNIGFLPVLEGDKVVGVVSERDLIRAIASGVSLSESVMRIATRSVITVREDEPVYRAAEHLSRHNIRHLVVVDEAGRLRGVLSIRDLLNEKRILKLLSETHVV